MSHPLFLYLQELYDQELPFMALRKSGSEVVQVMSQTSQKLHNSKPDNVAYGVFSKFQNSDSHIYINCEVYKEFNYFDIDAATSTLESSVELQGEKAYEELFEKAMKELQRGDLQKVVLSRKQVFKKSKSDLNIFEDLLHTYLTANCYFFCHPQVGKWMGATPEVLLEIEDEEARTMSLAGTAVNNGSHSHKWGIKEIEEQQIVTDYILNQFEKIGLDDITALPVETVQAGHLLHLRTQIKSSITSDKIEGLLKALHPTPAVCGLPRDASYQFIVNNEGYDRSFYTGYLGMVHQESHSYYVNLRCMELLNDQAVIYVGGGVTSKSDAQLEYLETVEKMKVMLRLL